VIENTKIELDDIFQNQSLLQTQH